MPGATRTSGRPRIPIPGLDSNQAYASRLSARSALYTDLQLLLDGQDEPLDKAGYRTLVVDENCLGRRSAASRRKLWKELLARYRLDAGDPLFAAFWTEWKRGASEAERALTAYVLFALNDRLVTDLGLRWLFPKLREAPAALRPGDVQGFLEGARREHPEVAEWSEATTEAVAKKYCASIRDFGLAQGVARKVTVRPALYGSPVRLLIRGLRLSDTPRIEIVQAPAFRLLAIDRFEVVEALGELSGRGELHFRMQGDVVELDLPEAA